MSEDANLPRSEMTEALFVERYGDTSVTMGDRSIPLSTALLMEAAFCPADEAKRKDESVRLGYLAKLVGDYLRPEHAWLLPAEPIDT